MAEDYYKTLGLGRNASQSDIEKAYRKMATKYHPDLHPDDRTAKEKFQKVQQAYDVLNDPVKREQYDRYGSAFESMGGGAGPQWRSGPGGGQMDIDFGQIFGQGGAGEGGIDIESIFRQFGGGAAAGGTGRRGRRQRGPARGADLESEIQVPFGTAINGGQASLTVQRPDGRFETLQVRIPPGIAEGKKIRVRGQGELSPNGGPQGDILITVHVAKHPHFRRIGDDLEVTVPITLAEAALGGAIDVPTPQGTIALKIPPCTSSGKRLRIKGHGAPHEGGRGDLYAEIQIVLPTDLSEHDKEWIRKFDAHHRQNPRAGLQW